MTKRKVVVSHWKQFIKWLFNPKESTMNTTKKNAPPKDDDFNKESEVNAEVDLDKEFMAQMWTKTHLAPEEVLQCHINFITAESKRATNIIPHELDVRYGSKEGQELDIFGTDLPDDAPILAYIPGGYWKELWKDISRFPALSLHGAGVKTFVVGYSCHRKATLWDIVEQIQDALLYVLQYAQRKGSRRVYLAGHCSGAHLIAKVLGNWELAECPPMKLLNGVFLISGIYDLREFSNTSANTINLERIDEISMSPLYNSYTHLEHSNIRFYILAAENDSPTFKKQSRDFYDFLFDICPMNNMFLEIKEDMNHFDIIQCVAKHDNYLKNLVLHDLTKYSEYYQKLEPGGETIS